jgi:hypothetical protein
VAVKSPRWCGEREDPDVGAAAEETGEGIRLLYRERAAFPKLTTPTAAETARSARNPPIEAIEGGSSREMCCVLSAVCGVRCRVPGAECQVQSARCRVLRISSAERRGPRSLALSLRTQHTAHSIALGVWHSAHEDSVGGRTILCTNGRRTLRNRNRRFCGNRCYRRRPGDPRMTRQSSVSGRHWDL